MTRATLAVLPLALAALGLSSAADPQAKHADSAPIELVLIGEDKLTRFEIRAEVDGVPVPVVWDETFAKLFAYFDRNGDGNLDDKETALLPTAKALRQAMGSGFTPPVGTAPARSELDRNGDNKVTADELAVFYRANGVGCVQIGVGRMPAGAELSAALVGALDSDRDGIVSEKECRNAAESLKKLDTNDDELVGAGELVPRTLYPGAAGTVLLTPPSGDPPTEVLQKLPLVLLPADPKDSFWATEIAKRTPHFKSGDLTAWRKQDAAARWTVNFTEKAAPAPLTLAAGSLRIEGWLAPGTANDTSASARKQIAAQLGESPEPGEATGPRRGGGGLAWLVPTADRDGDGTLDAKELDAWLDLQTQISRGQVLLTVLDGGGLFEVLDANHDGALSIRELRGAWDRLKAAGCVTGDTVDMRALPRVILVAASHGYPRTLSTDSRRGPAWFRSMDRNGDGDVSRREFTGPAEVFDKLDLDKDGLLSPEEAEKAEFKK